LNAILSISFGVALDSWSAARSVQTPLAVLQTPSITVSGSSSFEFTVNVVAAARADCVTSIRTIAEDADNAARTNNRRVARPLELSIVSTPSAKQGSERVDCQPPAGYTR
jgi:hypothetical protein